MKGRGNPGEKPRPLNLEPLNSPHTEPQTQPQSSLAYLGRQLLSSDAPPPTFCHLLNPNWKYKGLEFNPRRVSIFKNSIA